MSITKQQLRRIIREEVGSTVKYNADPALKGGQTKLPDNLQKAIIDKADEEEEQLDEAAMDWLQGGLDIVGLIPGIGVGEAADAINAVISLGRGNPLEALLSAISIIPAAGDVVGKGGKVVLKLLDPAMDMIKNGDKVADIVKKIGPEKIEKAKSAINIIKNAAAKYGPKLKEIFAAVKAKNLDELEKIAGFKVPDVAREKVVAQLGKVADKLPETEIQAVFQFLAKLDVGDKIMGTDDYKDEVAADLGDAAGEAVDAAKQKLAAGYVPGQSLSEAIFGESYTNEKLLVYGKEIQEICEGKANMSDYDRGFYDGYTGNLRESRSIDYRLGHQDGIRKFESEFGK